MLSHAGSCDVQGASASFPWAFRMEASRTGSLNHPAHHRSSKSPPLSLLPSLTPPSFPPLSPPPLSPLSLPPLSPSSPLSHSSLLSTTLPSPPLSLSSSPPLSLSSSPPLSLSSSPPLSPLSLLPPFHHSLFPLLTLTPPSLPSFLLPRIMWSPPYLKRESADPSDNPLVDLIVSSVALYVCAIINSQLSKPLALS